MECGPGVGPVVIPKPTPSRVGGRSVSHCVIRICDHTGAVRYEVVEYSKLRERELAIQQAYVKAARDWKPGQNGDAPLQQPRKPEVRVWRSVMGGPDALDRADAIAAECRKKELKRQPGDAPLEPEDDASEPETAAPDPGKGKTTPEKTQPKNWKLPNPLVK